jgi:hypothetical protein
LPLLGVMSLFLSLISFCRCAERVAVAIINDLEHSGAAEALEWLRARALVAHLRLVQRVPDVLFTSVGNSLKSLSDEPTHASARPTSCQRRLAS